MMFLNRIVFCHITLKLVLLFPQLKIENDYKKRIKTQANFKKPSKDLIIMVTKIFLIAGCVLAVAANVVRVVQDQGNGYQDENKYYEPKKTDYELIKNDYKTKHTICIGKRFLKNLLTVKFSEECCDLVSHQSCMFSKSMVNFDVLSGKCQYYFLCLNFRCRCYKRLHLSC